MVEKPIRVSYIISTRNRADFLDTTLDNVREFITPEDELIIVDGASTDHTAQIVEKYRDIVALFISEPDFGEAHGFNKGILASRGRLIKPLSDDDYFYPEAMRRAVAAMESHPELDAILCGGEVHRMAPGAMQQDFVGFVGLPPKCALPNDVAETLKYLWCGLGLLLSRRAMSLVGLFDTTFRCVDTDYVARLVECGAKFRYLDVNLYRHTRFPHSGSNTLNECRRDDCRVLLRNREWRLLMRKYGDYTWAAQILGLSNLPGGDPLMRLIYYGERLRDSTHRLLRITLGIIVWIVELIARAQHTLSGFRALWTRWRCSDQPSHASDVAEPVWDGTLR